MASSLVSFIRYPHLFQNGELSSRDLKNKVGRSISDSLVFGTSRSMQIIKNPALSLILCSISVLLIENEMCLFNSGDIF